MSSDFGSDFDIGPPEPGDSLKPLNLVTVARFSHELEAQLAKEALEDEGLTVQLIPDFAGGSLPGLGDTVGGFVLQVPEGQSQRAEEILDEFQAAARESAEEDAERSWLCPRCDTVIHVDMEICPSCGALREEPDESSLATAVVRAEDLESMEAPVRVGDKLAARALRAAVLGLVFCPPLLHCYSVWLLARLFTYRGELSSSGMRHMLFAVLLDILVFITIAIIVLMVIHK